MKRKIEAVPPFFYSSPNPHLNELINPSKPVKTINKPFFEKKTMGKSIFAHTSFNYQEILPLQGTKHLIDYYTRPGDVVLDPVCSSGMTGVAANELGRKAILCDVNPAATYFAYNISTPIEADPYTHAVNHVLKSLEPIHQKLYQTTCRACGSYAPIQYMIWSDQVICNYCKKELILWEATRKIKVRTNKDEVKDLFYCNTCSSLLDEKKLKRKARIPTYISYECCQASAKQKTGKPNRSDLAQFRKLNRSSIPEHIWYPKNKFPEGMLDEEAINAGIEQADQAYMPRTLVALAYLWHHCSSIPDVKFRSKLLMTYASLHKGVTLFRVPLFWKDDTYGEKHRIPGVITERNVLLEFYREAKKIRWYFANCPDVQQNLRFTTQNASVDYILINTELADRHNNSIMDFLMGSWLNYFMGMSKRANLDQASNWDSDGFDNSVFNLLREMSRVLKDNGWITFIYRNKSVETWDGLNKALRLSGFEIQGTQVIDRKNALLEKWISDIKAGQYLVLHCKKQALER